MFLVTGATGNAGNEVVRALAAADEPVRAFVRDVAGADLPAGVDAVEGDLNRPESVASALDGVRGAFLLERLRPDAGDAGRAARRPGSSASSCCRRRRS